MKRSDREMDPVVKLGLEKYGEARRTLTTYHGIAIAGVIGLLQGPTHYAPTIFLGGALFLLGFPLSAFAWLLTLDIERALPSQQFDLAVTSAKVTFISAGLLSAGIFAVFLTVMAAHL